MTLVAEMQLESSFGAPILSLRIRVLRQVPLVECFFSTCAIRAQIGFLVLCGGNRAMHCTVLFAPSADSVLTFSQEEALSPTGSSAAALPAVQERRNYQFLLPVSFPPLLTSCFSDFSDCSDFSDSDFSDFRVAFQALSAAPFRSATPRPTRCVRMRSRERSALVPRAFLQGAKSEERGTLHDSSGAFVPSESVGFFAFAFAFASVSQEPTLPSQVASPKRRAPALPSAAVDSRGGLRKGKGQSV